MTLAHNWKSWRAYGSPWVSKSRYALVSLFASLSLLLLVLNSNDTVQDAPEMAIHDDRPIPHDEANSPHEPRLTGAGLKEAIGNGQVASKNVLTCGESKKSELSEEEWERRNARRFEILSASGDAEQVLVAALIGPVWQERRHLPTLERALNISPDSVLVNWNLLQACELDSDRAVCSEIEERAIDVDGTNGAIWAEIAIRRADKGGLSEVVDALRHANAAPMFDYYSLEHVQMFERAFSVDMNRSYAARIQEAISSTFFANDGALFLHEMCKDRAHELEQLREQCLQLGRRIEYEGDTTMDTHVGLSLQREMLRISGSSRDLAEVEVKLQAYLQEEKSFHDEDGYNWIDNDQLVNQYIEQWSAHGQMEAVRFLSTETERLKSVPGYDPCPKVANSER